MTEIYIPAKAGPVVEAGERSWYAGPSSPVGRVLHCTPAPMRDTANVPVSCWPRPMQLSPRVDRDGMRRCSSCCQAERVPAGYGVPLPPKRRSGPVLSDVVETFVFAWVREAADAPYDARQLGIVLREALLLEAADAGVALVGDTYWELVGDGTAYGSLVATTDARRILRGTADGRVSA